MKYHQDFPFTPHSNDDVVTALLMVDEVTEENGPLEVVKGSHTGPIHGLWHDGKFTGAVAPEVEADASASAVKVHRAGRRRLPHAHPPVARLGAEHVGPTAHALYFGLFLRRRSAA